MAQISRRCVPFTPFEGELAAATVALVTAGGVHRRDQPPFNIADDLGDLDPVELMVTHHHYDHTDADRDINVQFPIERLRELAADKMIAAVASEHVGFMGYTMQLRKMYEETAPAIADHIDQHARPDAVVLTGG